MIIEGEFFSGGHLRWNLGWPTPNYAGAFLATVLALVFVFSGSRWRWAFFAAEAGGLFFLAKTYSRGALVAWGLAWLFGVVASRAWRAPAKRLVWIARVVILAVMMLAVGFGWSRTTESADQSRGTLASDSPTDAQGDQIKRNSESSVTEDGSVVNRLALWRGGLKMIAAAPLTGWGVGESGRAYMNWYQDIERADGYTTMVNSYLHVAVEHGLPMLVAALFGVSWLLAVAWRAACGVEKAGAGVSAVQPSREAPAYTITPPALMMAMGASLVAWAVANVFTTLWIDPRLWIVPAVASLVLGWSAWKNDGVRLASLTIGSLFISALVAGGVYGAGRWLLGGQTLVPVPGKNGSVMLFHAGSVGQIWDVWPDPVVLGPAPGKELRRWLEAGSGEVRLVVHRATSSLPGEVSAGAEGAILFGRQAGLVGEEFLPDRRGLWIVHPSAPPPSRGKMSNQARSTATVILPQIDEAGNGPAWRRWARENGASVIESPGSGLDIRMVWPAVMSRSKEIGLAVKVP